MKILLSYSKLHFDPARPRDEHKHWGSSASVLARTFHALLSELGEVTYVDPTEVETVRGRAFDLFVGVPSAFSSFLKACRCGRSLFIAVNRHPRERNLLLWRGVWDFRAPAGALAWWDLKTSSAEERGLSRADAILCVGNEATVDSYVRFGIDRAKIKRCNYGLPDLAPASEGPRLPGPRRVVYAASEIGLRKSFDLVDELARAHMNPSWRLDIVGLTSTPHYLSRLEDLVKQSAGLVTWHGWLDSASDAYAHLMGTADFLLFPSLEEGQPGTVLDGMGRGAVPLITDRCGFDFAPLGYLQPKPRAAHNHALFRRALRTSDDQLAALRRETLAYYQTHHAGFVDSLRRTLARFVREGTLHPKIGAVLPVFNKEKTLRELLTCLDEALGRYPKAELHVILDGCVDGSERVARGFFSRRSSYPVTFAVTPNVFEVKSNNLGLRKCTGEICAIIQDDNYLYDRALFFEAADVFERDPRVAIVGGLAGVNFYPRGTRLVGPGQISVSPQEVYWRQDARTDPQLRGRVFEVDACMRGPLFVRKSFLEAEGYLDEAYAPLYMDDMDLCFRAWARGHRVCAVLMDVENRSLTMAAYDEERNRRFDAILKRNTDLFYARHSPSADKSHLTWLHRHHHFDVDEAAALRRSMRAVARKGVRLAGRLWRGLSR